MSPPESAYSRGDVCIQDVINCRTLTDTAFVSHRMYEDFIQMVRKGRSNPNLTKPIQSVCDYIELHIEEKLALAALAKHVGYQSWKAAWTDFQTKRWLSSEQGFHVTQEEVKYHFTVTLNKLISCRDEVITDIKNAANELYDTASIEEGKGRLLDEMSVLAEMIQTAINENVREVLDQTEYQNRYNEMTVCYTAVKEKYDKAVAAIADINSAKAVAQKFISTLTTLEKPLVEFSRSCGERF